MIFLLFNSQVLRQDKAPLDKSALPDDERQQLDDFLNQMRETKRTSSIITKDHQNNGVDSLPIRSKSSIVSDYSDEYQITNYSFSFQRVIQLLQLHPPL